MNKLQNYLVIIVIVVMSVATSNLFGQQADENHPNNEAASGITNARTRFLQIMA